MNGKKRLSNDLDPVAPEFSRDSGLCVLLVEDDMCIALMLEHAVRKAGFDVLKASRLRDAMALAESAPIDGAILDMNLCGSDVFPAADVLRERDIPFLFLSAYSKSDLPARYRDSSFLQKPFKESRLEDELAKLIRCKASQLLPLG